MPPRKTQGAERRCTRCGTARAPYGDPVCATCALVLKDARKVSSVKAVSTNGARQNEYNSYNLSAANPANDADSTSGSVYTTTQYLQSRLYPDDYPTTRRYFDSRAWLIRTPSDVARDPSEMFTNAIQGYPVWLPRHDEDVRALGPRQSVLAIPESGAFALGKLRFREAITRLEERFRGKPAEYVYLSDLLREVCIDTGVSIDTVFKLEGEALTKRNEQWAAWAKEKKERAKKKRQKEGAAAGGGGGAPGVPPPRCCNYADCIFFEGVVDLLRCSKCGERGLHHRVCAADTGLCARCRSLPVRGAPPAAGGGEGGGGSDADDDDAEVEEVQPGQRPARIDWRLRMTR